jgi:urease accessory protein
MYSGEAVHLRAWRAELGLGFERRGPRSVLASRRQDGPLAVQKPLYPEGEGVCHAIVLHPPGGIAGGDELEIAVRAGDRSHALLTTPGAAKWYRTAGPWASQTLAIEVGKDACVEWLPQETIVFDGALARMKTEIRLAPSARYIGWEILCLGRSGSGERFSRGTCRLETRLTRGSTLLRFERGSVGGGSPLLDSPAGLAGNSVCGTLLASAEGLAECLSSCREQRVESGEEAVTLLSGVLVARYLGASSEGAKKYFAKLWSILRPAVAGREAAEPRIWRT